MSTRSTVAIVNTDGSITASYVHFDGYVEGVGKTLLDHYNDTRSAARVARIGYASSLAETVALSRKGARNKAEPLHFASLHDYEVAAKHSDWEYLYLWIRRDENWRVKSLYNGSTPRWCSLSTGYVLGGPIL